jgi:hypothetical protein
MPVREIDAYVRIVSKFIEAEAGKKTIGDAIARMEPDQ